VREVQGATATEHRAGRVKERRPPAERGELVAAARRITGLLEQLISARSDLVGTDHDRLRMYARHRAGLLERQPERPVCGRLAGQKHLTHTRCECFERQTEPYEQLASIYGARGEDQCTHGTHALSRRSGIAFRKQ